MRKCSITRLLAVVALGLLCCATLAFGEKPKEVVVVNDANEPVPVSIANTPVPVTMGTKETVSVSANCDTGASFGGCSVSLYTVPSGKRLVVEYFSCSGQPSAGQGLTCRIWNVANFVRVYLPTSALQPAGPVNSFIAVGQQVKLYAAAGEMISAGAIPVGSLDPFFANFDVIGYLEDAP
jgi:hypothetical protein